MKNFTPKQLISAVVSLVVVIVLLCSLGSIGEDVKNNQIVVNQMPFTGTMKYWTEPGFQWQWFGKTTHYYKTQQLWFGAKNDQEQQQGNPIKIRFNDASEGMIYGSLRVKLPTDEKHLSRIQTDYNGMDRLMNDLVRQTVGKAVYASGPLMSAFESVAEKKNDLIDYIADQLNYGVYKTQIRRVETTDPVTGETKTVNVASLIPDTTAPGGYKRSEVSPFSYYGLEISQVAINEIDYPDKVTSQIEEQQKANMAVITARSQSLAAQQEAIRAEEQGKAEAAKARWEQEKIKAVAVTKAEQEFEVARLEAQKAAEVARKVKAEGEAEAYRQAKLVQAGLSPKERAEYEMKTKIGVAEALSKIQLPKYVSSGGNGNSAWDAIFLQQMKKLVDETSK